MKRKDCDKMQGKGGRRHGGRGLAVCAVAACACMVGVPEAYAGSVRVWSSAVVASGEIRLGDVCELRGFSAEVEKTLEETVVVAAPQAGESLMLQQAPIRKALRASGANMATTTVSGASRCHVSRPAGEPAAAKPDAPTDQPKTISVRGDALLANDALRDRLGVEVTLRDAVVAFFDEELRRYDARAEVTFDRTSEQILNLSGPDYSFHIRRRGTAPLGLISIQVDVTSRGAVVQNVPLVVLVSMVRKVVVARRAINADATITASDVSTMSLRFNRVDKIGLTQPRQIVGQRARRFITAGSVVDPGDVESVPLVVRGQLITVDSTVGGITVVTTAKAAADARLGENVRVRLTDNKRVEFDAIVVGVGRARLGAVSAQSSPRLNLARVGS